MDQKRQRKEKPKRIKVPRRLLPVYASTKKSPRSSPHSAPGAWHHVIGYKPLPKKHYGEKDGEKDDEIEAQVVDALMKTGIRYIDESGNGSGPFWVLEKNRRLRFNKRVS